MLTQKHEYGINSEEIKAEFNTFCEDKRSGRLMMLCLTPYVCKDMPMTSFAMAERVLRNLMLNDAKHPADGQRQGISFAEIVQR